MRPRPFKPEVLNGDSRFVRDAVGMLVWHRVFNRSLYADTDRSSVVYHSNYLRYFELGRATLMRDVGYPYKEVEEKGYVYPIIDLGITFHKPLRYDDPMWVHTRPGEMDRIRVKFHYIITHSESGDIICTGFTQHCALNPKGWPVPVDEKTVHMWETFPK